MDKPFRSRRTTYTELRRVYDGKDQYLVLRNPTFVWAIAPSPEGLRTAGYVTFGLYDRAASDGVLVQLSRREALALATFLLNELRGR